MTKEEYHQLAPNFDLLEHKMRQLIDQIPKNINPTGKLYKKKLQEIRESL